LIGVSITTQNGLKKRPEAEGVPCVNPMNKKGPIVVIEDDLDDQHILTSVFNYHKYENEIVFFQDGAKALAYLQQTDVHPFLILSDVNMPKISGFELKKMVHTIDGLSQKCIPFLFFTTASNAQSVVQAYSMSAQGYFVKPTGYQKLSDTIKLMIDYWRECSSPNDFDPETTS
jgi:DNA-binding NtrC family response regulator